jgi:hypothetical protein
MNTIWDNLIARAAVITAALMLSTAAAPALADDTVTAPATTPAQTKDQEPAQDTSGFIREYLSDPRRTGSLAGSIFGGALFATPAAPIIGSVIGFFFGKKSMYDEDKVRAQQAKLLYARRDIAPHDSEGNATPTLSFGDSQGITFDSAISTPAWEAAMPGSAAVVTAVDLSGGSSGSNPGSTSSSKSGSTAGATSQGTKSKIPSATLAGYSREAIMKKCSEQGRADPYPRILCFYLQGG